MRIISVNSSWYCSFSPRFAQFEVRLILKDKRQEEKMNNQTQTFVSVVMATHNHESYLSESIQSVLSQTHTNFELIIVNDNSTDATAEIIRRFAKDDQRIVCITNDQNLRQSDSRNRAIRAARGEYIAIVDSDDISLPDRFAKQLAYFSVHPDCDVLGSAFCLFFDAKIDDCKSVITGNIDDIYDGKPLVHCPTCMMKRSIFSTYGFFNSKYDDAEDYELWSRWFSQGVKFHNVPEVLYKKRIHEGCVSLSKIKHQIFLMLKINLIALFKYQRQFTRAGYFRTLEQFLRLVYLILRLDKIFRRSNAFDRMRKERSN
jgi:glycosyltransferase involved in cell wall biosynthesis